MLLWLATEAVRKRSPVIEFESAAQILKRWGVPSNGEYYRRIADAFKRVFASTIFFGTRDERRGSEVWDCSRAHFFDHVRLWFQKEERGDRRDAQESGHALRCVLGRTENSSDSGRCGCGACIGEQSWLSIDLYTWLTWRCYQARGAERIPLFGPSGLAAQLGVQEYSRERKFRERIRDWLKLVSVFWPECPAAVSADGRFLELKHGTAIGAGSRAEVLLIS